MKHSILIAALLAALTLLAACGDGGGSVDETPTSTSAPQPQPTATETVEPTPAVRIPNAAPATELTLPPGFTAYAIADGFFRATSITLAPDGAVYVSERHGNVYRLADNDGDGVFEERVQFSTHAGDITGLMVDADGLLYVSSTGRVTSVRDTDGDTIGDERNDIISGLPNGRHQNNGLVIGPDGLLYLTNGSTCDECEESDPLSATILQANADGSGLRVYARGLRNPYDLVFDGQGRLWATDNGSDEPCATIDELNLIVDGGDYGWPYGADGCDPLQDGIAPVADLGLHTASTGIDVYDGEQFPAEYRGSFFALVWGSFFAEPDPYDRVLLRVVIEEGPDGPRGLVEQFGSGFRHPIDVVVDRDGTLLVLDYGSGEEGEEGDGTLYRIVYTGG